MTLVNLPSGCFLAGFAGYYCMLTYVEKYNCLYGGSQIEFS